MAGGTSGIFSNDLLAKVEYPDATTGEASTSPGDDVVYGYNALGEETSMTDQNGTTHDYSRDVLGRENLDSVVTLGSGVDGSIRAIGTSYNSQGLPFQETSYSNAAGTTIANQDQDVYNGLGQLTGEYQLVSGAVDIGVTPEVQYGYSDPTSGSLMTSMTYPNGRELDYIYNSGLDSALGRVSSESDAGGSDAGVLQSYSYLGLNTVLGEADGNGITETTTLDNFGRTGQINYVNTATDNSTDNFTYGYDRDGNVLYKENLLNGADSELYHASSTTTGDDNAAYDPLNRLVGFERGTLTASGNNGSTLDTVSSPVTSQSWNLDAVGNQSSVTTNGSTTSNTTNAKNELTVNGSNGLTFDNDGNTLADGSGQTYTYDAWNRLATAKDSAGAVIASYNYDAQSRRIADATAGQERYYDSSGQEIEDRNSSDVVTTQDVWAPLSDAEGSADGNVQDLVLRDDSSTPGSLGATSSGLGERLYVQQDANDDVTALTNTSGAAQERFIYDPYGTQTVLSATWGATTDAFNWVYGFQGGRVESGTGVYHFGARDYSTAVGRWIQQDPAGYVNGASLYQLELSSPVRATDPTGLVMAIGSADDDNNPEDLNESHPFMTDEAEITADWGMLDGQIVDWNIKHWGIAVDMLKKFMSNSGGIYDLTWDDISALSSNQDFQSSIVKDITNKYPQTDHNHPNLTFLSVSDVYGERWWSGQLAYAFGSLKISYNGDVEKCNNILSYNLDVNVTKTYNFGLNSWIHIGSYLVFGNWDAAHDLFVRGLAKSFTLDPNQWWEFVGEAKV